MSKKNIIASAAILTAAGIITRVLGFVYRIYMSNIIGAEGMGLYQLIMPVYALAWSLSCSGFTTTLSKLTAQEKVKGEYGNMNRFLKQSLIITSSVGTVIGFLLFFFSYEISYYIFKEPRIILSLRILAFGFPFMAAGSCIRGYFFGLQEATIPAISQVFEQIIRMFVIYILASTLMPLGIEYAVSAAVIGIVVGEVISFLYVIFAYSDFKNKNKNKNKVLKKPSMSSQTSLYILFSMSMPLTLNRVSGSLLSTVENVLIPRRLLLYGFTNTEAISEFGKLTGMAMPLIQFPSVILVSLAISLVPVISEALALNNYNKINLTVSKTILFTTVIGAGAAGGFILFADRLGYVIYKQDISEMLLYLGLLSPFFYMQMVLSGILNGLGQQVFIFRNSLISSCISICFIYFVVPILGVVGFILGWFISLLILCTLSFIRIKKIANIKIDFITWFFKPIISIVATMIFIRTINYPLYNILGDVIGLIASITITSIIYIVLIVLTGCINKDDIKLFKKR